MEKQCFKCKEVKPLTGFYAHPQTADGRLNKCKECAKKDVRTNYAVRRPRYQEYERVRARLPRRKAAAKAYQRTEAGKVAMARSTANQIAKNPVKRKARIELGNALRDGKVVKRPCEVCGSPKSEGHHHDYLKPLDVQWLCSQHHHDAHKNIRLIPF